MAPALQMSLDHAEFIQTTFRKLLTKYFYVAFVLNAAGAVLTFVMLKIVPVMVRLFQDFELELPAPTVRLIAFSDIGVRAWPLVSSRAPTPAAVLRKSRRVRPTR